MVHLPPPLYIYWQAARYAHTSPALLLTGQ